MINIAVISDIHANLPALNAVLDDIREHVRPDHIYCLGDLTDAAPWHNEVITLIRSRNIPTIMGNHDERIAFDLPVLPLQKHSVTEQEARLAAINFTKATIDEGNRRYLAGLPANIRFEAGGRRFLLVHGSANSNDEYLYENHNEPALLEMLEQHAADVMICGHTHLSYIRPLTGEKKLVINTGAVGRTKEGDGKAAYLWLQIQPDGLQHTIRKVTYNTAATIEGIRNSPIPDFYAAFWEEQTAGV